MLALPLLLGLVLSRAALPAWGIAIAAVLAFLSHYALVPVVQRLRAGKSAPASWSRSRWNWGSGYLAGAALAFGAAFAISPAREAVAALALASGGCAAVYFAAAAFGSGRGLASELVGMIGMALAAPLTAAAAGVLDRRAWTAASIAFAYSLSSLAFVRAQGDLRENPRRAIARCIAAHAAIVVGLVALAWTGRVAAWPLVALLPPLLRTAWGLARPPANLRVLGRRELGVAASLAVIGAVALAL